MMNRTFRITVAAVALAAAPLAGCDLFEVDDRPSPNGIALEDILANPTEANITNLAVGTEASSRVRLETYLSSVGTIGREYYRISPSDPRFTADLLGKENAVLDDNTFYITAPWAARYATIRNANTLLQAVQLNGTLSQAEKDGASGFAKTWKAYQYLLNLNLTYENGIRFIAQGEDQASELVGYAASLDRIATLLDEAAAELDGGEIPFPTTIGADYYTTNRALASRVDLYREDYAGALTALDEAGAFGDDIGALEDGAYHVFSGGAGDALNDFAFPFNATGDATLAHPSFVADIDTADTRISKVRARESRTSDGLSSAFGVNVYPNATSPIPIITNGELVLNRAEALLNTGNVGGAIEQLDIIRLAAGFEEYDGAEDAASVREELIYQRRYQLYAEGHRWVDARRYGILDQLPIDREGDDVFVQFPVPANDSNRP